MGRMRTADMVPLVAARRIYVGWYVRAGKDGEVTKEAQCDTLTADTIGVATNSSPRGGIVWVMCL